MLVSCLSMAWRFNFHSLSHQLVWYYWTWSHIIAVIFSYTLTWHLIGWQLCCPPIRCQVWRVQHIGITGRWYFTSTLGAVSLYPPNNEVVGGYIGFTPSVRPSVCPSVRPSRLPCTLCNIYSSGWILSILATNDHYHERVCRTQWPLTLTYIFKVIWPWLRKSCPLCSVYSSGWILFIFSTNDHYH